GLAGIGEFSDPIHEKFQRFLRRVFTVLDIAHPDSVVSTAVPSFPALAMQNGDCFPSHTWPVACKLRRAVGLVPNTKPNQRYAGLLQLCGMLPGAGHHYPAFRLCNGIAAEFHELRFGDAVKINLRC